MKGKSITQQESKSITTIDDYVYTGMDVEGRIWVLHSYDDKTDKNNFISPFDLETFLGHSRK